MKNRKEAKPALQPLGLAYIAGTLIANGFKDVEILDVLTEGYYTEEPFKDDYIRYGLSPGEIRKRIKEYNPDIVGVSCLMDLRKYHALEICKIAKSVNPHAITVIGGNPVTVNPQWYLKNGEVDIAVLGEGEKPFLEIVKNYSHIQYGDEDYLIGRVNGIAVKTNAREELEYVVKPQIEWEKDIDNIARPAHHLLKLDKHLEIWEKEGYHYYPAKKFTSMIMARGCPHQCRHCPHNVLFKGYRFRSAKNVFDEVKYCYENLGIEEVQFHEYNGIVVWSVVEEFCKLMIVSGLNKKISWGWPIGIWLKILTYDRLKLMREAGMMYVDLAIESHSQIALDKLMKGKDVDSIAFFIAQPIPGTPFWDECANNSLFLDGFDTFHLRYGKSNIKVSGITPKELEEYRHKARKSFVEYWKSHGRKPYKGKRGEDFLERKT